jgi:hypothetical protein
MAATHCRPPTRIHARAFSRRAEIRACDVSKEDGMTVMRWMTVCAVAMTFFAINCNAGTAQIPNAGSLAAARQALGVP